LSKFWFILCQIIYFVGSKVTKVQNQRIFKLQGLNPKTP